MKENTQKALILKYIDNFGSITSYQAYVDLGITQLATRIKELKKLGYVFGTTPKKKTNRYGVPVHFVEYYLIERVS